MTKRNWIVLIISSAIIGSLIGVLIHFGLEFQAEAEDVAQPATPAIETVEVIDYSNPKHYTEEDIYLLAQTAYCEGRGVPSKTELACVMWTVLNRVDCNWENDFKDLNTIKEVVLQPNQFAYSPDAPLITDHGYDLYALAQDVLDRWSREKNGDTNVGRVLPPEFLWYASRGDGHNYFRSIYRGPEVYYWDYSLESPYES